MKTNKEYPFINAVMLVVDNNGHEVAHDITFDAREVVYYHTDVSPVDDKERVVTVGFKSGKEIRMVFLLDEEVYPDDNLITAIDMVQYSHFWHDNEDSLPDEDEE